MGLRGARLALERPAEAFKAFQGFEGGQTAGLNAFKSTWPWYLAAAVSRKICLGQPAGGEIGFGKACETI